MRMGFEMQHNLKWRQPTPKMQLETFPMQIEGIALMPSLTTEQMKDRIEFVANDLRELIPYIKDPKQNPWVDINGLRPEDECPNCKCGTLGYEGGRLICRGECGTDYSPQ